MALNVLLLNSVAWRHAGGLLFFRPMRRFDDMQRVTVGDITYNEDGSVSILMGKSKTDQVGHGFVCDLAGVDWGAVPIPQLLQWYVQSLRLTRHDYLFPRLSSSGSALRWPVSYTLALSDLKALTTRLGLPVLTLHAGRIGGTTLCSSDGSL